MSEAHQSEIDLAHQILVGVQRIMKGPGKRYWTMGYSRFDHKTEKVVRTHRIAVGGDSYWTPAWMYYDPNGPSLVIYSEFGSSEVELLRIDLTNPRSLVRSNLRACFKKAIERYAEKRHELSK